MASYQKSPTVSFGKIRCDLRGVSRLWGTRKPVPWSQVVFLDLRVAKSRLRGARYILMLQFKSGAFCECVIRGGPAGLGKLYRLNRLITDAGAGRRLATELLKACSEAFTVAFEEDQDDSPLQSLRGMKMLIYSLEFSSAGREYRRLRKNKEAVVEATRLAMAMKQFKGDHRGARKMLNRLLKLRGFAPDAEVEYAINALQDRYRPALEVCDRLIDDGLEESADLALAKAQYFSEKKKWKAALNAVSEARSKLGTFNVAASKMVDRLESDLCNEMEYRKAAWKSLILGPFLSKICIVAMVLAYCFFLARPAFESIPDNAMESASLVALVSRGAQASQVIVEPGLYPSEDGHVLLRYRYLAADKDGQLPGQNVIRRWIPGESKVTAKDGMAILGDSSSQIVRYDEWDVAHSEVGPLGASRHIPIWSQTLKGLSVPFFTLWVALGFAYYRTRRDRAAFLRSRVRCGLPSAMAQ